MRGAAGVGAPRPGAVGHRGDLRGRSRGHDPAPGVAALGTEVEHQVAFGDDVEVVLDHDHRVARVHQPVEHPDQALHVGHVQPDGRLVEHVEGVDVAAAPGTALAGTRARPGQLGHQLDALRLAPAQARALLAEGEVAEADILQQLQRVPDAGVELEVHGSLVDAHGEHVRDALVAEAHLEGLCGEPGAAAGVAGHRDVRQEAHLDGARALAFALLAAAALHVEREAARGVAAHTRLRGSREKPPHVVPDAHVGGRARPRGSADRGLVDLEHPSHRLPARDRGAPPWCLGPGPATAPRRDERMHVVVQHVAHQGALPAAAHARDARHAAEREGRVDAREVVQAGAFHAHRAGRPRAGAPRGSRRGWTRGWRRNRPVSEVRLARICFTVPSATRRPPFTPPPGPRSMTCSARADGLLVVLDHDHRVALVPQTLEGLEQHLVVPGVQADGRLVEDVAHPAQVRAELRGEADPLGFAAAQRRRRAVEREVRQPDLAAESRTGTTARPRCRGRSRARAPRARGPRPGSPPRRPEAASSPRCCGPGS